MRRFPTSSQDRLSTRMEMNPSSIDLLVLFRSFAPGAGGDIAPHSILPKWCPLMIVWINSMGGSIIYSVALTVSTELAALVREWIIVTTCVGLNRRQSNLTPTLIALMSKSAESEWKQTWSTTRVRFYRHLNCLYLEASTALQAVCKK